MFDFARRENKGIPMQLIVEKKNNFCIFFQNSMINGCEKIV